MARKTKTYDLNSITEVCNLTGYSMVTILNWHYFNSLPIVCVKGVWCGNSEEIKKWIEEYELGRDS